MLVRPEDLQQCGENELVPVRRGCGGGPCACTGACNKIVGYIHSQTYVDFMKSFVSVEDFLLQNMSKVGATAFYINVFKTDKTSLLNYINHNKGDDPLLNNIVIPAQELIGPFYDSEASLMQEYANLEMDGLTEVFVIDVENTPKKHLLKFLKNGIRLSYGDCLKLLKQPFIGSYSEETANHLTTEYGLVFGKRTAQEDFDINYPQ